MMNKLEIKDKHDFDSVERIIALGHPENKGYLDEMLSWSIDRNWPIASRIHQYFVDLGVREVERVKNFLLNIDLDARYDLLLELVGKYDLSVLEYLKKDLIYWANSPGSRECEIISLEILVENNLIDREELKNIFQKNVGVYRNYISILESLIN